MNSKLVKAPIKWAIYNEEDGFISDFNTLYKAEKALKLWKKQGRLGCSGPFEVGWTTTVVIDVRGGNIQSVHANDNIRIIVRDWDNIEEGSKDPLNGLDMAEVKGYVQII